MYIKLVIRDANDRENKESMWGFGICDGLSVRVKRTACSGFRIVLR